MTESGRFIACFALILALVLLSEPAKAQLSKTSAKTSGTTPISPPDSGFALLAENNITTWHRHDGTANRSPLGIWGGRYPVYSRLAYDSRGLVGVIYADGLVWGGKVFRDPALTRPAATQPIRVGGSTYFSSTQPGWIVGSGASANPVDPEDLRVRSWWSRNSANRGEETDVAIWYERKPYDFSSQEFWNIVTKMDKDWIEWPVDLGAPYIEKNGIPGFQPIARSQMVNRNDRNVIDEPGFISPSDMTPAAQTLWMVYNDLDTAKSKSFASSLPIGLEIQKTVWAYPYQTGFHDVYFTRYLMINKGGVDTSELPGEQIGSFWVDSMYVQQWSDPDLGSMSDDYLGCDTILQIGYAYNGRGIDPEFHQFKLAPASIAYFVAVGPAVPSIGETAIRSFRKLAGHRNLPMSSFLANATGDFFSEPPQSPYEVATARWWKILRGFVPFGDSSSADQSYPVPNPSYSPRFIYPGDPVTNTGWTNENTWDGFTSDQRLHMSFGPFSLAPGDSQELVVATVAGIGSDRLSSVAVMKSNVRRVRSFVSHLFDLPVRPHSPYVRTIPLDRSILLEWGSHPDSVLLTESSSPGGDYVFEGYTVYALETPGDFQRGVRRRATFDKANGITRIDEAVLDFETSALLTLPAQLGMDAGVQRFLLIDKDEDDRPLINGHEYSFAVTAYSVATNPTFLPRSLESNPTFISAIPGKPFDMDLVHRFGDSLAVVHQSGAGTTEVTAIVVDPTAGTGESFEVRFDTVGGTRSWSLHNAGTGQSLLTNQQNFGSLEDFRMIPGGVLLLVRDGPGAPSGPADVYRFAIPAPSSGPEVQTEHLVRIGIFPNPLYLSTNTRLGEPGERKVTFTNLPQRATIRIYNLAGHLVRRLEKDSPSQYFAWDALNKDRWLVASGIYICHLEFPDLGKQIVLKLAVIQGYPE